MTISKMKEELYDAYDRLFFTLNEKAPRYGNMNTPLEQVARFYHYYDTMYKSCQVDPTQRHMEQEIVRQWMVDLKTRDARWSFISLVSVEDRQ